MDLKAFALQQIEIAKGFVLKGQEVMPTLIFDTADGGQGVGGVPNYGDHELKEGLRMAMRELMKEKNAVRYAFVMEAWMSTSKTPTPAVMPSKDPKRKEAIVVSAADNQGAKILITCMFTRGKKIVFDEPDVGDAAAGALLELLDDKKTMH